MSLEARVQRLEDREELKELRARYCYCVDTEDWESFFDLFTDDPVLDFGGMGVYEGRDGLEEFTREFVDAQLQGSAHMLTNPILDIDGDRATGKWYVEAPITFADGSGAWRQGYYRDEYRRVDRTWKIAHSTMRFLYTANFDDGWSDLNLL